MGKRLRDSGNEYGAVTGRPRRCGWYDAVAVRYAVRINGLDALALTKLDVLDGLDADRDLHGLPFWRPHRSPSSHPTARQLAACEPVYESMPGWQRADEGRSPLRRPARERARYVARLEEVTGVPAALVSTGSERDDTILRDDVLAASLPGFKLEI